MSAGQPGGAPQGKINIGGIQLDQNEMKRKAEDHFRNKVMVVDDIDRQVYELVTNVPRISKEIAIVAAIMNFVFPGLGTCFAACMS